MQELYLGLAAGAALGATAVILLATARAGGASNAVRGLTIAGRAHVDPAFAQKAAQLLAMPLTYGGEADPFALKPRPTVVAPKPAASPAPAAPTPAAMATPSLQLLSLLQAESRLVDFLMEDLTGATAEQIGNAARDIQAKARKVLADHLSLGEILPGADQSTVTVPAGFDPSAIRVVGNVTGKPPFTGTLQHPGWKVRELKLPAPASGADPMVIQPAEVALG